MTRDNKITDIRPLVTTIDSSLAVSTQEQFQNETLRPIIKFQHELIMALFKDYIQGKKIDFESLSIEKRAEKLNAIFQNDRNFVMVLKGIILGYFTIDEYQAYTVMKSELNKRIVQIIKERILSVVLK